MEIEELEDRIDDLQSLVDRQADHISNLEEDIEEKDAENIRLQDEIYQMKSTIKNAIRDLDTCL